VCARCGQRRRRMPKTPQLVALPWGSVYCELCRETRRAGQLVAWWLVPWKTRRTAYCPDCHWANVRARRALKAAGEGSAKPPDPAATGSLDAD
jgi:hypothetical protein